MSNISHSNISPDKSNWSSIDHDTIEYQQRHSFRLFQWWNKLTTPAEPPVSASFIRRDNYRKACLFSNVTFFLLVTLTFFIPACLFLPNSYIVYIVSGEIVVSCACLFLNRLGQLLMAGIIQVVSFEVALTGVVLIMTPVDNASIQILDLFIMGTLLAVSLLPMRYVFLVVLYNSFFIWLNISYQPHTLVMTQAIHSQFILIIVRAIGLQFIVAGVSLILVHNTTQAISRADKAEMVTTLEHTLVEQRRELESGIEQILQTHVAVANGNLNARAPLAQDHVLWHIARALNNLLVRLQRALQAEKELHCVEQAVTNTVSSIQNSDQQHQPARILFTHTAIDPLLAAIQGKTFVFTHPPAQQNNSRSTDPVNMHTINTNISFRRPLR
jgi:hypothetical protein